MIRVDKAENLSGPGRLETNEALVDLTLEVWQPLYQPQLSREDARQIAENLTGFFRVLLRWKAREVTA
ncbi:MAG: hypothetical protein ACYDA0_15185 [Candidatus Dormibacteraceae bacterium]